MKTIALIVLTTTVCLVSPAHADEQCASKVGEQLRVDGMKSFNLGRYSEAVDRWEKAYELCPIADILFNLAQAHRKLNNLEKARDLFRSYLRESTNVSTQEREDIQKKIAELEDLMIVQKRSAESPPEGIKGSDPAALPPGQTSPIPSDPDAQQPGLPNPATSTAPQPVHERWYRNTWGWMLVGTGTAAVLAGGGFLLWSQAIADDAAGTADHQEAARLFDDADAKGTIGVVTMVGGGAVLVGGVILFAWHGRRTETRGTTVAVGSNWVGLTWSF